VKSGQQPVVHFRFACDRALRYVVDQAAFLSLRSSEWARAYDYAQRARGHSHREALRALGATWPNIISSSGSARCRRASRTTWRRWHGSSSQRGARPRRAGWPGLRPRIRPGDLRVGLLTPEEPEGNHERPADRQRAGLAGARGVPRVASTPRIRSSRPGHRGASPSPARAPRRRGRTPPATQSRPGCPGRCGRERRPVLERQDEDDRSRREGQADQPAGHARPPSVGRRDSRPKS